MPPVYDDTTTDVLRAPGMTTGLLTLAIRALSSYALTWLVVLGAMALWTYAVHQPTWVRIVAATGYCVTLLLPLLIRETRNG